MKPVKLMLLSVVCATLAVASGATANASGPTIAGMSNFSGVGAGAEALTACKLTTSPFYCADGDKEGAPDCTCTEYSGTMKGIGVGVGTMTLDLVEDESNLPGSFITVPAPGSALVCYAVTGVGLMQAKTQLPILLFAVGGYLCPVPGSLAPSSLSGSFDIINPELGAQTPPVPSQFPNASGSGAMAAQFSSTGSISFILNGELKK